MKAVLALLLLSSAAAFAPAPAKLASAPLAAKTADMAGVGVETGGRIFDPLGLSTLASDKTLTWFRASELKHGRIAMLASAGFIVNSLHFSLPGYLSTGYDIKFSQLAALPPLEAWEKVPLAGKLQILAYIACVEAKSEMGKPHYLKGGDFVKYDFFNLSGGMSAETLLKKQNSELKNGRLAMIGVMSFIASAQIPGSVPLLPQ